MGWSPVLRAGGRRRWLGWMDRSQGSFIPGSGFGIVIAPEGAALDYTDHYLQEVENVLSTVPERRGPHRAERGDFLSPLP